MYLNQPIVKETGILSLRGQDYHHQVISYGSRHHIHVFRKGELHRHGLVFTSQAEYQHWLKGLGKQLDLAF
jgi:hypothetical protein